jgi:uroporphyrinogen-III synthase
MTTTDGGVVLVTRSEPGATDLARAIVAAGFTAVTCPMLEVRRVDDADARRALAQFDRVDVAIFVSGHAVRFAFEAIDAAAAARLAITWIAVGASTAATLARNGIAAVVPAVESSEGILALPQLSNVVGKRVLVCAGAGGRTAIAEALARRGATVETVVLYRRDAVPVDRLRTRVPEPRTIRAVVVSSGEGAAAFTALWRSIGGGTVAVVAPSQRVADALSGRGFVRVVVSNGAGAAAVIAALEQIRGR